MYKYVLNSVPKISLIFAQYFEYYAVILRGAVFSWTHTIWSALLHRAAINELAIENTAIYFQLTISK